MRARLLLPLLLAVALLAPACGGATGIVLALHSGYRVPDQVDSLLIHMTSPTNPPKDERINLSTAFPQTLVIQTEGFSGDLTVEVQALKEERVVTTAQFNVQVVEGQLQQYELTL